MRYAERRLWWRVNFAVQLTRHSTPPQKLKSDLVAIDRTALRFLASHHDSITVSHKSPSQRTHLLDETSRAAPCVALLYSAMTHDLHDLGSKTKLVVRGRRKSRTTRIAMAFASRWVRAARALGTLSAGRLVASESTRGKVSTKVSESV